MPFVEPHGITTRTAVPAGRPVALHPAFPHPPVLYNPLVTDADLGTMHFDRLDDGTDQDFEIMRRVHERNLAKLPDQLFSMLSSL